MAKTDKLTKKEMDVLKKNVSHLETSYKHKYCLPILQSQKIALADIYTQHISTTGLNLGCSRCILKMCQSLYELYINNIEGKTK